MYQWRYLLSTIKSRCTRMQFGPIKNEEIKRYIKERYPGQEISDNIIKYAK